MFTRSVGVSPTETPNQIMKDEIYKEFLKEKVLKNVARR